MKFRQSLILMTFERVLIWLKLLEYMQKLRNQIIVRLNFFSQKRVADPKSSIPNQITPPLGWKHKFH